MRVALSPRNRNILFSPLRLTPKKDEAGGTELFVTDGSSELLSSKCCFFLRNAKEGASLDTARYTLPRTRRSYFNSNLG